jgi:hypothetical protein
VSVFAETALNSGRTHQVNSGCGDYLDGRNLGNVSNLVGHVAKFL